jgi:GntR family transcriptional regulator
MPPARIVELLKTDLDPSVGEPLSRQIVERVWLEVVEGRLSTGSRLPTVRELAIALGISPRSVERAYLELERLGVTSTRPGEGTFVSLSPPSDEERRRRKAFAALCREAVNRAAELGFSVEELLQALAEFRRSSTDDSPQRTEPR